MKESTLVCKECGVKIQETTARMYDGLCAACAKGIKSSAVLAQEDPNEGIRELLEGFLEVAIKAPYPHLRKKGVAGVQSIGDDFVREEILAIAVRILNLDDQEEYDRLLDLLHRHYPEVKTELLPLNHQPTSRTQTAD